MKKWSATRAPAGRIAYVNGRYLPFAQAGVHVEDRALQLGDGIYEVCNVIARRCCSTRSRTWTAWSVPCASWACQCRWAAPR